MEDFLEILCIWILSVLESHGKGHTKCRKDYYLFIKCLFLIFPALDCISLTVLIWHVTICLSSSSGIWIGWMLCMPFLGFLRKGMPTFTRFPFLPVISRPWWGTKGGWDTAWQGPGSLSFLVVEVGEGVLCHLLTRTSQSFMQVRKKLPFYLNHSAFFRFVSSADLGETLSSQAHFTGFISSLILNKDFSSPCFGFSSIKQWEQWTHTFRVWVYVLEWWMTLPLEL